MEVFFKRMVYIIIFFISSMHYSRHFAKVTKLSLIRDILKITSWVRAVPSSVPALKALLAIFIL